MSGTANKTLRSTANASGDPKDNVPGSIPKGECDEEVRRLTEISEQKENGTIIENDPYDLKSQQFVRQRCHHLARSFRERTQRARRRFDLPPTPSTISSDGNNVNPSPVSGDENMGAAISRDWQTGNTDITSCGIIEPQGILYIFWITTVTGAYLYNCFVIPLRTTFPYQTPENTPTWLAIDYSMDAIYLIDLLLFKPRIVFLDDGFWVKDIRRTRKNYLSKPEFKMDVISLIPLDFLYLYIGTNHPLLRLPRMLKIHSFWEFFNHFDKVLPSPYIVRIARTLTYMVYLVHINACAYFAVSVFEGIASNKWTYNGIGNAYVRCMYFAVKTATSIGKNPKPENSSEYMFMTASWLTGVFVFAILIGQIRDIIATATKAQTEYRKLVDETLDYLRKLSLPQVTIERVKTWFTYTWQQQHTLDEARLLDTLPHKLKTDVAINVHISTINKVQLFKDCEEALLRDLVLKLRPVLFLPGDYICRKGEVGKEMYIVKSGQVQVVSPDGKEVLATLTEGSVFGEISLLSIAGCNRRTADVRSNGFSSLFTLSKDDLNEALKFHPNAQDILKKKARQLMKQNAAREKKTNAEILIQNPETPKQPKLLPIVLKVLPPDSGPARLLKYGSRYGRGRPRRTLNSAYYESTSSMETGILRVKSRSVDYGQLPSSMLKRTMSKTMQGDVTVHGK